MACVSYIPRRFIVTAYIFIGFMVMLYLRANLSIAIVDMTSNQTIKLDNSTFLKVSLGTFFQNLCNLQENLRITIFVFHIIQEPEFNWTTLQLGIIISAFNYGYLFAPPGGMLAARYGGATVFGLGVLITGCLTVLTPIFCRVNLFVFILTRMVEGIFEVRIQHKFVTREKFNSTYLVKIKWAFMCLQSFSTAATVVIFAHWAPPDERARLIAISFAGAYLGTSMNYPISGYIAKEYGWEAVFYISGEKVEYICNGCRLKQARISWIKMKSLRVGSGFSHLELIGIGTNKS